MTTGINWYLNRHVRAMLNWTQYWYTNPLGTPFSCGNAIDRGAPCGGAAAANVANLRRADHTSWELFSRIQFWF